MPRPSLIRSETQPYHVSSRVLNGEFFPLPLDEVWYIMVKELHRMHREYGLAIHAFVLMGNHFHLLCHATQGNLDKVMQQLLRMTSVKIARRSKIVHQLWSGRYKWSLIESQSHYFQVYRYIYQNPLRAKIVSKVEKYPFSTLNFVPFPLHTFVPMSFAGKEGELLWLNEKLNDEDIELLRLGLRKHLFDINKRRLKTFNKLSLPNTESRE